MHTKALFTERQRFNQWWVWLILISINAGFLTIIATQLLNDNLNYGILFGGGINFLMTAAFFLFRLDTEIRQDGVYVRFIPFHFSFRKFAWDSMAEIYVRQYSPIGEFGGWGLRYGLRSGKVYNVSGNKGIQIVFDNGSRLLIGTSKPEDVERILAGLGKIKRTADNKIS